MGDDVFLCHHLGLLGGSLEGSICGDDVFIRAGGGETACEAARFALGYSVGGSVTEGLLLGIPVIHLIESPDILVAADTLESPETLRECGRSGSVALNLSTLRNPSGLVIGMDCFLSAMSRAEEAEVCCDTA